MMKNGFKMERLRDIAGKPTKMYYVSEYIYNEPYWAYGPVYKREALRELRSLTGKRGANACKVHYKDKGITLKCILRAEAREDYNERCAEAFHDGLHPCSDMA